MATVKEEIEKLAHAAFQAGRDAALSGQFTPNDERVAVLKVLLTAQEPLTKAIAKETVALLATMFPQRR